MICAVFQDGCPRRDQCTKICLADRESQREREWSKNQLENIVQSMLREGIALDIRKRPELHAGEDTDDLYLCVVFRDEVVSSLLLDDGKINRREWDYKL